MVNVTKSNFLEKSQDLINRLPTAAYAAIDLEMTGITIPGQGRPNRDDTPSERYPKLKVVPEKYSIIQAGVALFHENPGYTRYVERRMANGGGAAPDESESSEDEFEEPPEFIVRKYNFYLFAPPSHNDENTREVVLNPGTISFLNSHNMDWNKWTREGVPFVTVKRAQFMLDKFKEKHDKMEAEAELAKSGGGRGGGGGGGGGTAAGGTNTAGTNAGNGAPAVSGQSPWRNNNRVTLTRAEDVAFVARTMASLREWIDSAIRPPPDNLQDTDVEEDEVATRERREREEGKSFLLPPCNAFLRRALYENLEEEYPTLIPERADGGRIRVLRLSAEEKIEREKRMRQEEWNRLHRETIGFTDVFRALSAANKGELVEGPDGQAIISPSAYDSKEGYSRFNPDAGNLRLFNYEKAKAKEAARRIKKKKAEVNSSDTPRKVPIIVHNGLMDLLFLLTHCHSPQLPQTYSEAKRIIHDYFPNVYDTKILSTECSDADVRNGNTALGALYKSVCPEADEDEFSDDDSDDDTPPRRFIVQDDPSGSSNPDQMHEAAYDALMTGAVFQALSRRIMRTNVFQVTSAQKSARSAMRGRDSSRSVGFGGLTFLADPCTATSAGATTSLARMFFGRNKIYLMTTMYTIDLEKPFGDALSKGMLPEATFRVSGIEKSLKTRDIQVGLKNAIDRECANNSDPRPTFEIVWVDDYTFMIATRERDDGASTSTFLDAKNRAEIVRIHGRIVESAVRKHFNRQTVVTLKEYLEKRRSADAVDGEGEGALTSSSYTTSSGVIRETVGMLYDTVSNLAVSMFGKRGRSDDDAEDESEGGAAKRRRVA